MSERFSLWTPTTNGYVTDMSQLDEGGRKRVDAVSLPDGESVFFRGNFLPRRDPENEIHSWSYTGTNGKEHVILND